ncbi:MAG: hypothetical protein JWN29_828, partial [Acidimicrobiales bacterium]|nr:hypothetical protein [Acidimicrobiales bacterium]
MFLVAQLAVVAGLAVAVFVSRARAVDDELARAWAARHGVLLTPGNAPMVTWYLQTSRVLRVLGVVAGLLLPPLVAVAAGLDRTFRAPSWPWVFAGYLVASLYAEVAL